MNIDTAYPKHYPLPLVLTNGQKIPATWPSIYSELIRTLFGAYSDIIR